MIFLIPSRQENCVCRCVSLTTPIKYGLPASPSRCEKTICRASAVERRVGTTTYCTYRKNHNVRTASTPPEGSRSQRAPWTHQQDVGHDGPVHGQEGLPQEDEGLPTRNTSTTSCSRVPPPQTGKGGRGIVRPQEAETHVCGGGAGLGEDDGKVKERR